VQFNLKAEIYGIDLLEEFVTALSENLMVDPWIKWVQKDIPPK
jgi:hypothetical protein